MPAETSARCELLSRRPPRAPPGRRRGAIPSPERNATTHASPLRAAGAPSAPRAELPAGSGAPASYQRLRGNLDPTATARLGDRPRMAGLVRRQHRGRSGAWREVPPAQRRSGAAAHAVERFAPFARAEAAYDDAGWHGRASSMSYVTATRVPGSSARSTYGGQGALSSPAAPPPRPAAAAPPSPRRCARGARAARRPPSARAPRRPDRARPAAAHPRREA